MSHAHIFAITNALNSFFLPSSRRTSGPRLSACVPVESLGPDFHRDDEKTKCLLGWPSNLWTCRELWREMKLKKICAYGSPRWGEGKQRGFGSNKPDQVLAEPERKFGVYCSGRAFLLGAKPVMEVIMNWDRVEGNWKEIQGKAKQQWGKLTDDDLDVIEGRREELEGRLQKRYGYAKDKVRTEVDSWLNRI